VTAGPKVRRWHTAILPPYDVVHVENLSGRASWFRLRRVGQSGAGSWTAATVRAEGDDPITVVSVYAAWERVVDGYGPIWAGASAHRIHSEPSPLLLRRNHRLLTAGDRNLFFGYGERGKMVARRRYQTVSDRTEALGLTYLGAQAPDGGRQTEQWPAELPRTA
jgi:hypothetical protein